MPDQQGRKDDALKLRLDLIPPEVIYALAYILTHGAQKYEPHNWERGFDWSRPFAALQRHLWSWWGGHSDDDETQHSHLWNALCELAFLVTFEIRGAGNDDRVRCMCDPSVPFQKEELSA